MDANGNLKKLLAPLLNQLPTHQPIQVYQPDDTTMNSTREACLT